MELSNSVTEFILLGLAQDLAGQKALFVVFLLIYIVTMVGNLLIVGTEIASPFLDSPMYFFFAYLSLMNAIYSIKISPKLLTDTLCAKRTISFPVCMVQLFVGHLFGGADVFLLVAMGYDHYMAICKPLHYLTIMNHWVCILLLVVSSTGGLTHSLVQVIFVYNLPLCGPNIIDHFSCDMYPLLGLACTNTYMIGLMVVANGGAICMVVFVLLLFFYCIILSSLKHHSQEAKPCPPVALTSLWWFSFLFPAFSCMLDLCSTFPLINLLLFLYSFCTHAESFNIHFKEFRDKSSMQKLWCRMLCTYTVKMVCC